MSTPAVLKYLRQTKNAVIGNPLAKLAMHQEGIVDNIVRYVNASPSVDLILPEDSVCQIRIEAANILASMSRGPPHLVQAVIAAGAPMAILTALRDLQPTDPENLRIAFVRALRAVCIAASENACAFYNLPDQGIEMRSVARAILDYTFQDDAMSVYLPLLEDPSVSVRMLIAELLAFSVRVKKHRTAVTEWMPESERMKTKSKRGWEMTTVSDFKAPSRQLGWVTRHLTSLLQSKESKVVEASLWAIYALVQDNAELAVALSKLSSESRGQPITNLIWALSKDRRTHIRLAACQCASGVIRATSSTHTYRPMSITLLHALTNILSSKHENNESRAKACRILAELVRDDHDRCLDALKTGSLITISDLIKQITPTERPQEWDDGEAKGIIQLREAALAALASLALLDNDIRTEITDKLAMLPRLCLCLGHPQATTRLEACSCIRSLSRAVQVLRTAILDSGVTETLCRIVEDRDEDFRVMNQALAALSNLVTNFSPLRKNIVERGLLSRISELCRSQEDAIVLSSLWVVKNLLDKASKQEKLEIMEIVAWNRLLSYIELGRDPIREQGLNILCNIASNEEGIELLFNKYEEDIIINTLADILRSESEDEEVLCQAMNLLANVSNGRSDQQAIVVKHKPLLSAIKSCMTHQSQSVRLAAVSCVEKLAREHSPALCEAKIDLTLRHIVKSYVHGVQSPSMSTSRSLSSGIEPSEEVREKAKQALRRLEVKEDYTSTSS